MLSSQVWWDYHFKGQKLLDSWGREQKGGKQMTGVRIRWQIQQCIYNTRSLGDLRIFDKKPDFMISSLKHATYDLQGGKHNKPMAPSGMELPLVLALEYQICS